MADPRIGDVKSVYWLGPFKKALTDFIDEKEKLIGKENRDGGRGITSFNIFNPKAIFRAIAASQKDISHEEAQMRRLTYLALAYYYLARIYELEQNQNRSLEDVLLFRQEVNDQYTFLADKDFKGDFIQTILPIAGVIFQKKLENYSAAQYSEAEKPFVLTWPLFLATTTDLFSLRDALNFYRTKMTKESIYDRLAAETEPLARYTPQYQANPLKDVIQDMYGLLQLLPWAPDATKNAEKRTDDYMQLLGAYENCLTTGSSHLVQENVSTKKRPTIAIRCQDITLGMQFYREFQRTMATVFPREYDRPKMYLDLGGDDLSASSLLSTHRNDFDLILIPAPIGAATNPSDILRTPAHILDVIRDKSSASFVKRHLLPAEIFSRFQIIQRATPFSAEIKPSAFTIGMVGGMGPEADGYTLKSVAEQLALLHMEGARIYAISDSRVPRDFFQKINIIKLNTYRARLFGFIALPEVNVFIAPSNTFHTGLQFTLAQVGASNRFHNIISAVEAHVADNFSGKKIGLLATIITMNSGIYEACIRNTGAIPIKPDADIQAQVDAGIRAMKEGDIPAAKSLFLAVANDLFKQGADYVLLGCTEIPLALEDHEDKRFLDSASILGAAVVADFKKLYTDEFLNIVRVSLANVSGQINESELKTHIQDFQQALNYAVSSPENYTLLQTKIYDYMQAENFKNPLVVAFKQNLKDHLQFQKFAQQIERLETVGKQAIKYARR